MGVGGEAKNFHHRRDLRAPKVQVARGVWGHALGKSLKSGPL